MDHQDLIGYYTYRSFLNRQDPADDFNRIRFGEGELFLWVAPDGVIQGTLGFPADPLASEKDFMDITGRVTSWSPPAVELEGLGRPETGTEAFDYKYQAILAPSFPDAEGQRAALVGTVMRAKPHDSAPAGFTASLIAVKRDFLRPKDIPGVVLIPDAIADVRLAAPPPAARGVAHRAYPVARPEGRYQRGRGDQGARLVAGAPSVPRATCPRPCERCGRGLPVHAPEDVPDAQGRLREGRRVTPGRVDGPARRRRAADNLQRGDRVGNEDIRLHS